MNARQLTEVAMRDATEKATAGGTMFHDAGYAGLPDANYPTAGLLDKEVHRGSGGQGEIANGRDDTLIKRPLSIPSALLIK